MTIGASTAWGSAIGSGSTGPFAIPFALYNQTDLTVLQVTNNVPTTMRLGTDYTFTTWNPDNKGYVQAPAITFTIAVPGGTGIIFLLIPPGTQPLALSNFAAYFPAGQEAEYDKLLQYSLMINERANKSIKAPDQEQSSAVGMTLPAIVNRANKFLGFDANGNVTMLTTAPVGSVSFSGTGLSVAAIATLLSLQAYLGFSVVANQAGLAGLAIIAGGFNFALQQDTGQIWYYQPVDGGLGSPGWVKVVLT